MPEQEAEVPQEQLTPEQLQDIERQRQRFVDLASHINSFCLDYGCFFAVTRIRGIEASYLEACVSDLKNNPRANEEVYRIINDWFTALEYHPHLRAYFVYRAQRTPFFKEFSHHLERGVLLYYKGDFFSAVNVLFPAVEGILRLYVRGKSTDLSSDILKKIKATKRVLPLPEFAPRHRLFRDFLERFLRRWFFAHTAHPRLKTIPSSMNRHYMAHLIGTEAYYHPYDCNRLFACFDVMLELITLEFKETGQFIGLYRDDIPEVNERRDFYSSLLVPWSPWQQARANEERFMEQNANYESSPVPNWAMMLVTLEEWWQESLKRMGNSESPIIHTIPPGSTS